MYESDREGDGMGKEPRGWIAAGRRRAGGVSFSPARRGHHPLPHPRPRPTPRLGPPSGPGASRPNADAGPRRCQRPRARLPPANLLPERSPRPANRRARRRPPHRPQGAGAPTCPAAPCRHQSGAARASRGRTRPAVRSLLPDSGARPSPVHMQPMAHAGVRSGPAGERDGPAMAYRWASSCVRSQFAFEGPALS